MTTLTVKPATDEEYLRRPRTRFPTSYCLVGHGLALPFSPLAGTLGLLPLPAVKTWYVRKFADWL